jgi:hypothetical protein
VQTDDVSGEAPTRNPSAGRTAPEFGMTPPNEHLIQTELRANPLHGTAGANTNSGDAVVLEGSAPVRKPFHTGA